MKKFIVLVLVLLNLLITSQTNTITWKKTNSGNWKVNDLSKDIYDNLYACTDQGIFKTTNSGISWQNISLPSMGTKINVISIDSNNILYVGTLSGMFVSADLGATWTQKYTNSTYSEVRQILALSSADIFVSVWDTTQNSGYNAFHSTNFGTSWALADSGLIGYQGIKDFMVDANGTIYALGGNGLILHDILYKWDNLSTTWISIFSYPSAYIVSQVCNSENDHFMGSTNYGMVRSDDHGLSWNPSGLYPKNCGPVLSLTNNSLIIGTSSFGVYQTSDLGQSWYQISAGLPTNPISPGIKNPILSLAACNYKLFSGTRDSGVYVTNEIILKIPELINSRNALSIYPNPATDKCEISFDPLVQPKSIYLLNSKGMLVETIKINSENKVELNVSFYHEGLYLLVINFYNYPRLTYKLLVQKE